jgi:hypothetical protein
MHICRVIFFFVRIFECENVNICFMCYLEKRAVTERYRYIIKLTEPPFVGMGDGRCADCF